jgi:hypothetical protein
MGMQWMVAGAVKVIQLMWTDPRVWNGVMVIELSQETQPKHTKMSLGGITQARGRVRGGPVCRNTSSKIGGSITICSSKVRTRYTSSTRISRV